MEKQNGKQNEKQYRVIGQKGRLYLPRELMRAVRLREGEIARLEVKDGEIIITPVTMVEVGDHSREATEKYVEAAAARFERGKKVTLAAGLLRQAEEEAGR